MGGSSYNCGGDMLKDLDCYDYTKSSPAMEKQWILRINIVYGPGVFLAT
jgi:hypothetical protein